VEAPLRPHFAKASRGYGGVKVLSHVVASSEEMHVKTGGIVPEVASREQLKSIIPVIDDVFAKLSITNYQITNFIDAVAVTVGPGLVGSLLVGVETAKALAYAWNKPIIPMNHLVAHLYANFVCEISNSPITNYQLPEFPAIGLVVSGGHTDLVLMKSHTDWQFLGGTRDDAAGECLDKCARVLGLSYPGGPAIAAEAAKFLKRSDHVDKQQGPTLPRPLMHEETWDFSFSGLKAAVARTAHELRITNNELGDKERFTLAHEVQEAVVEVLVDKLEKAVKEFKPKSVLLGGGVSANQRLREEIELRITNQESGIKIYIPPIELCTDNAVMIGAAALLRSDELRKGKPLSKSSYSWKNIRDDPGLEIV